jgi:hypothetical protein
MATSSKFVPGLVVGVLVGGFAGGVGGYITHDLVEKPNPETMEQIEQAEQTQQGVDDFLNSLGGGDAGAAAAPRDLQRAQGGTMAPPRNTAGDDVVGGADSGTAAAPPIRAVVDAGVAPSTQTQEFYAQPLDEERRAQIAPAASPDASVGSRPGEAIDPLAPLPGSHPDYAQPPQDQHVPARLPDVDPNPAPPVDR